jgi:alkylation response protein AidB-like acyl-CoA dehydrogenase
MAEPAAMTEDFWEKLTEQGWFGILSPEERSPAPASKCMAVSA